LPEALTSVGNVAASLLGDNQSHKVLAMAGDLTLRLIERGRLGTPAAASESLTGLTQALSQVSSQLPPAKAEAATRSAVDLALKLLETNSAGPASLATTLGILAQASASLLPESPAAPLPGQGPRPGLTQKQKTGARR
jgi:hypothetical protein